MLVDYHSRLISVHEWFFHPDMVNDIFWRWGTPHIDLFATQFNRKRTCFFSFQNHSPELIVDAFLLLWKDHLFYIFPLIPLVHKILLKVRKENLDSTGMATPAPVFPTLQSLGGGSSNTLIGARSDHSRSWPP